MSDESIDYGQIATILASPPGEEPVLSLYVVTDARQVAERSLALRQILQAGEQAIRADPSLDARQQKHALAALDIVEAAVDLALSVASKVKRISRAQPELEALGGMASVLRFQ